MFLDAPGSPNRLKRAVYLLLTMILGVFLSLILGSLAELSYWRWFASPSQSFSGSSTILQMLWSGFLVLGAVGGFFLGRFWWWKVYVERSWAKRYSAGKKDKSSLWTDSDK